MEVQCPPPATLEGVRPQDGSPFMSGFQRILFPQNAAFSPSTTKFTAEARHLPSRDVTDEGFDDAYVRFILYCNPAIPIDTNPGELRRSFKSPPKSDGQSFNTFTLFELIRKLELKEIKTWAQLAKELGVEPPALDKGQSAQKVQQYAVRLKRWMRAMHVDAFFEYLQDKPHVYWTEIPLPDEPQSDSGRDGVPPEEDLALRALLPETRPKRGRRKAEDKDDDGDYRKSPAQRPRIDSPTFSDDFGPARTSFNGNGSRQPSAHAHFSQSFEDKLAPWSALEPKSSITGAFRWPPPEQLQTPLSAYPLTAYPQSATTPSNRALLWHDTDEPRSAITPSKSRYRRRHGPAVSSAWSSKGSASTGKLRGRPPSNRSVTDGPFSTFPANPVRKEVPTIQLGDNTPVTTPIASKSLTPHFFPPTFAAGAPSSSGAPLRPSRLQLQVPQRQGGAVRLATPPPMVLVNGESDKTSERTIQSHTQLETPIPRPSTLTKAATPVTERSVTSTSLPDNDETDRTNVDALESHFISEMLSADWYDNNDPTAERCSVEEAAKIFKLIVRNLWADTTSTESFLSNLSALAGGPLKTRLKVMTRPQVAGTEYECHWKMRFGSVEGGFTIKVVVEKGDDAEDRTIMVDNTAEKVSPEESWKKRYLKLQREIKLKDEKLAKLKMGLVGVLAASDSVSTI